MSWIMLLVALIGTILLSSKQGRFRKVRLFAFSLWVFSNAYWAMYAGDTALRTQFFIYLCLAIWGVYNNSKEVSGETGKAV